MKRIFEDRKDVLMRAIDLAFDRHVYINRVMGEWKVGWSSIGSVDPMDAEIFTEAILAMVDVANMLTRQQIKFVEIEALDPGLDSDERFEEGIDLVAEWFESGEYRKIEAWIIAGDVDDWAEAQEALDTAKNDELISEILSGELDPE